MTIRLNKVTRDFHVGINRVVEFLQKKGIVVEASPSTKITEEQYALLTKEFSADKDLKIKSGQISKDRQHSEQTHGPTGTEGHDLGEKKPTETTFADRHQSEKPLSKTGSDASQLSGAAQSVHVAGTSATNTNDAASTTSKATNAPTHTPDETATSTSATAASTASNANATATAATTATPTTVTPANATATVTATPAPKNAQQPAQPATHNPIVHTPQPHAEGSTIPSDGKQTSEKSNQPVADNNSTPTGSTTHAQTEAPAQQPSTKPDAKPDTQSTTPQAVTASANAQPTDAPTKKPAETTQRATADRPAPTTPASSETGKQPADNGHTTVSTTQAHTSKPAGSPSRQPDVVAVETSPGSGVYTVAHEPAVKLTVVGTIDPKALNSTTRPGKKTKEERKKEREEKEKLRSDQRRQMREDILKEVRGGGSTPRKSESSASNNNGSSSSTTPGGRKKRHTISQVKVDINNPGNFAQPERNSTSGGAGANGSRGDTGRGTRQGNTGSNGNSGNSRGTRTVAPPKQEVSDEDVAKQVKETLARLTSKAKNKGVKYRKDKREQAVRVRKSQEEAESKVIKLTEFVTANELANMMDVPVTSVISTCMSVGIMVSINQRLDAETINLVADEFGFKTEYVSAQVAQAIVEEADAEEDLEPRAPIVTVMGHVDHGKTSLLDYIRKSNVIAGEAGGITQHIGAYNVTLEDGRKITFLDTPGHEAFTAMRARGAKVTDIAIIIVAADDSVMPQTKEAINHATAAGVPIVFAINKIDKPGANPEKIKEELAAMNFLVEDWGGKYQSQDISAKKGIGVNELMEKVLLEAEMLELKANPNRRATGSIIESSLDKGRGYVATVLVSNGTLKVGDIVLAGTNYGRVKAMFNERNQRMKVAHPAEPALILGLNGAPAAGDTFHVTETEQEAREITGKREQLQREQGLRTQKRIDLAEMGRRLALGDFHELNIIVKGDVDGSVEALSDSLIKLSTEHIQVNVIHKGVGQISESDVSLASASKAIIVGFQVRPSGAAVKMAEQEGVDIRKYSVIYDAIEEVKAAMIGMLAPTVKEQVTATLEVREVFNISKVGLVAGAMVKTGKIKRADRARLIRDGIVIFTGSINALKRFKDDVKEVGAGFECGISLVACNDIKTGDVIESFEEVQVERTLE